MAKISELQQAEQAFKSRQFSKVISLLEPMVIEYKDSFRCWYLLGVSCMYLNDFGGAEAYLNKARRIKLNSTDLMVAQGALFLQRGEVARAVEYYLEALELSPNCEDAKKALKFIRLNSDNERIQELRYKGKLKRFLPSTGLHPNVPILVLFSLVIVFFGVIFALNYKSILGLNGVRADLSNLALSVEEKSHPLEVDLSTTNFRYILTSAEVSKLYSQAQVLFQQGKDNEVQIKLNQILNSNASTAIKYKANLLLEYLEEPTFEDFTNSFTYGELIQDIYLYQNCWIILSGRISNVRITESVYFGDLLVGYEDMKKLEGTIPIEIMQPITIDSSQAIKVLGKVVLRNGKLTLEVKSVYQPLKENL